MMKPENHARPKIKKQQWKISPGPAAKERLSKIADRLDIPVATLASIALSELSFVRPEAFFEALGAIPADLKTRPVGRPAGATSPRKDAREPVQATVAA